MKVLFRCFGFMALVFLSATVGFAQEEMILSELFPSFNKYNYNVKITRNTLNNELLVTWVNYDSINNRIMAVLLKDADGLEVKKEFSDNAQVPPFYELESYDVTFHSGRNEYFVSWVERKSSSDYRVRYSLQGRIIDAESLTRSRVISLLNDKEYSYDYVKTSYSLDGPGKYVISYSRIPMDLESSESQEQILLSLYDPETNTISLTNSLYARDIRRVAVYANLITSDLIPLKNGDFALVGEMYESSSASGATIFLFRVNSSLQTEKSFFTSETSLLGVYPSIAWNGRRVLLSYSLTQKPIVRTHSLDKNLKRKTRAGFYSITGVTKPSVTTYLEENKRAVYYKNEQQVHRRLFNRSGRYVEDMQLSAEPADRYLLGFDVSESDQASYLVLTSLKENSRSVVKIISCLK